MFYCTSFLFIPAHKCLFSISFHPHAPPPFSIPLPLSSRLPSIPRARSLRTCWTGFFWLPSNSQTCSRRPTSHSDSDLFGFKGEVPLLGLFGVKQERQRVTVGGVCGEGGGVGNRKKKRGSELLGCAFLWLAWLRSAKKTCCWLFSLLSPSHMGWQALGVWWDTFVCVHMHAIVCQGKLDGVIMRTLQLL